MNNLGKKESQAVVSPTMEQQMMNQQVMQQGVPDVDEQVLANFKMLVLEAVKARVNRNKIMSKHLHSMTPMDLDPDKSEGLVIASILFNGNLFYAPYVIKGNRVSDFDCLISKDGDIIIPPDEQWLVIASSMLGSADLGWASDYNVGHRATQSVLDFPEDIKLGLGQGGKRVIQAGINSFVKNSNDKQAVKDFLCSLSKFSSSSRVQEVLNAAVTAIKKRSLGELSDVIYFDAADTVEYISGVYNSIAQTYKDAGLEAPFTEQNIMSDIASRGFFLHIGEDYAANTEAVSIYADFLSRFPGIKEVAPVNVETETVASPEMRLGTILREVTNEDGTKNFESQNTVMFSNYGRPETMLLDKGSKAVVPLRYLSTDMTALTSLKELFSDKTGLLLTYAELKTLYGNYDKSLEFADPRMAWVAEAPSMRNHIVQGSHVVFMDIEDNPEAKPTDREFKVKTLVSGTVTNIDIFDTGVSSESDAFAYAITVKESDTDKEVVVTFGLGDHPSIFSSSFGRNSDNNNIVLDTRTTLITVVDSFVKDTTEVEELGIIPSKEMLASRYLDCAFGNLLKVSWSHSNTMVEIQNGSKYAERELWTYPEFAGVCKEKGWDFKKISSETILSGKDKGTVSFLIKEKKSNIKKVSFASAPAGMYSETMDAVSAPSAEGEHPMAQSVRETYVDAALVPWLNELAMSTTDNDLSTDMLELMGEIDVELLRSLATIGAVVIRLYTNEDAVKDLVGIDSWDNLVTTGKTMFHKLGKFGLAVIEFVGTIQQQ